MSLDFVSVRIQDGRQWTELNDEIKYKVEGSSFNDSAVTWRRTLVESPWISGRFMVHAVKDVVEEQLTIYVYGQDHVDLQDNIDNAIARFSQFSYILEFTLDENRLQFSCETADYSVTRTRELIHNQMAMINFRIPRIPEYDRLVDY